jgi:hypothetical protein
VPKKAAFGTNRYGDHRAYFQQLTVFEVLLEEDRCPTRTSLYR